MDQESFRQLLTVPRPGSSPTPSGTLGKSNQKAVLDPSQPAFKPRKVKKKVTESDYRDRASERRAGVNEYAKVESVLEDFEQRTADLEDREAVETQRKYLGGDQDHTILVKGLDLALLEQNKARAAASHEDDDSLEVAFQEAQSKPVVPKKRTREDALRELKEKRASGGGGKPLPSGVPDADDALEKAKRVGKFKPIGAPENLNDKETNKKTKGKEKEKTRESERRKKRRKVDSTTDGDRKRTGESDRSQRSMPPTREAVKLAPSAVDVIEADSSGIGKASSHPIHAPEEDTFADIFADAGEYEGVDFGEEDDADRHSMPVSPSVEATTALGPSKPDEHVPVKGWFMEDKEDKEAIPQPGPSTVHASSPPPLPEQQEEPELEQPTRLAPLASSALPSISDFLAMDAQADAQKKRRAKKEKKKGEKKEKVSTEVKVDRDYKKLNSYMAKKGGGSTGT